MGIGKFITVVGIVALMACTKLVDHATYCYTCIEYKYFPSPTNPSIYNKVNWDTLVQCNKSQSEIELWVHKNNIVDSVYGSGYQWVCKRNMAKLN